MPRGRGSIMKFMRASLLAALMSLGLSAPVVAASANLAGQFPARVIAAHNAARAKAGVGPIAWDASLARGAAAYAMQLALTNRFQHSNRRARPGVGENLWMGTRGAYSYEAMVGGWTSERRYFVPGVFPAVSRSGSWE